MSAVAVVTLSRRGHLGSKTMAKGEEQLRRNYDRLAGNMPPLQCCMSDSEACAAWAVLPDLQEHESVQAVLGERPFIYLTEE